MNIALNGCGRVARALIRHWLEQPAMPNIVLIRREKYQWRNDQGISRVELEQFLETGDFPTAEVSSIQETISDSVIDVWFEMTPTDLSQAERKHTEMTQLLQAGISIVFANKAPVVYDYMGLKRQADETGSRLGLSAVMGASLPGFALGHYGAMGATITEMAGILNSTTNFLLEEMEQGDSFDGAIAKAVDLGIAEGNWAQDVDGIDSGIKMSILASVLFERNISLDLDHVQGIRHITPDMITIQKEQKKRYKLVARYRDGKVSVSLEEFEVDQIFYHITGSQKILWLDTLELSEMSVINGKTGLPEVAASLHRDLEWIKQELKK